jgi:uncharacterized protein YndB with AHSA1/START domain
MIAHGIMTPSCGSAPCWLSDSERSRSPLVILRDAVHDGFVPSVDVTMRIRVPPEAVTRVLLDPEKAPQWTAGLERLEVVRGNPGEVGCVGRAHYLEGGRRYAFEDVLEKVTPNRRYVARVSGGGIVANVETTLDPIGHGETLLTLHWKGRGTALLTRIVLPLMKGRIARRAHADLRSLRDLAEGLPEPEGPRGTSK